AREEVMLAAGSRLGPYEIHSPLGAGGMGEVYKARDTRLDRMVAITVLPERSSLTPEARQRFEREATTIPQLQQLLICARHDVGREGDTDGDRGGCCSLCPHCPLLRALDSAPTRSSRRSAPEAWGRSTRRGTRASTGPSRSRSFRNIFRVRPRYGSASSE